MKLIIDIPEGIYKTLCKNPTADIVRQAVINGTPLEEYDSHSPIDEYDDADGNHCVWFGR